MTFLQLDKTQKQIQKAVNDFIKGEEGRDMIAGDWQNSGITNRTFSEDGHICCSPTNIDHANA